ncbi:MAG: hypothetical protein LBH26_00885 [Treponema sp.]|nr:hypothetical protein [Treponema sp.]
MGFDALFRNYLLEDAEECARFCLERQIPAGAAKGGSYPEPDILTPPFPRNSSTRLLKMITAWLNPESVFYQDPRIIRSGLEALAFLRSEQRPSGNIDLYDCNFDSAPDSGFLLWDLIPLSRLLKKTGDKAAGELREGVEALVSSALEGLRAGGFHTANHRWVISSALAAGFNITGNRAYLARAEQYLAEGVDCNEDGEYSERSAIYNAVNNDAMIMLYEELREEKYLKYVQRNLRMMLHFFESDGSLFTENSTRQDRGRKMFAGRYIYQYLYIARYLGDGEAARVAAWIAGDYLKNRHLPAPDCLYALTLHQELKFPEGEGADEVFRLPDCNRYFKSSGLVRCRQDRFTYSLLSDNPKWLCFSAGALSGCCKISLGYFSYGNVRIGEPEILSDGYRFSFRAEAHYFEPLDKADGGIINFRREDHSVRRQQHPNRSALDIRLRHRKGGVDITFTGSECTGVSYCFEFVLPAELPALGEHFALRPKPGDYVLLKDGSLTVSDGRDALKISGGFASRDIFATSRNGLPRSADGFTLYMNGTVPFCQSVSIEAV